MAEKQSKRAFLCKIDKDKGASGVGRLAEVLKVKKGRVGVWVRNKAIKSLRVAGSTSNRATVG
jgi:hypothetical protein